MKWKNLVKPRVLIIEDVESQLQGNKNDLETISTKKLRALGIEDFACDLARSVEEAEVFFRKPEQLPYDFLLLDLGIPKKTGEKKDPPENGQKILEKSKRTGSVKEVIVISVFKDVFNVTDVFRNGAIDFVAKPFETEVLQARVMETWKRLLIKESRKILGEERIRGLIPYNDKGLAHRFTTCFSELVQEITRTTDEIERYVHERYGLDRTKDTDDFFFKCLKEQNDSLTIAQKKWRELQSSLVASEEFHKTNNVETLLKGIHRNLFPSFIVKNTELHLEGENASSVLSFEDDVSAVIGEIIVGGMIDIPDHSTEKSLIHIDISKVNGHVRVRFSDNLQPLTRRAAEHINKGTGISPDRRFGRAWGLSIVQHIAMRGGGRLEIQPHQQGNVVTYHIPTA